MARGHEAMDLLASPVEDSRGFCTFRSKAARSCAQARAARRARCAPARKKAGGLMARFEAGPEEPGCFQQAQAGKIGGGVQPQAVLAVKLCRDTEVMGGVVRDEACDRGLSRARSPHVGRESHAGVSPGESYKSGFGGGGLGGEQGSPGRPSKGGHHPASG